MNLDLLNKYTQEVLAEATEVALTLPEGWNISVSAGSDVVLEYELAGQWIGLYMKGIDRVLRTWRPWRGSLILTIPTATWSTLEEACTSIIVKEKGKD